MLRYLVILTSFAVLLALALGCDDRGSNITRVDLGELQNWGNDPSWTHPFTPAMTLQLKNPQEITLGAATLPPDALNTPVTHPMPLLILLAPEGGNRFFYFKAGLGELVRELTASGEIQPMVVFCLSNKETFGGYFYADSDPAGHYDAVFHYDPNDGVDDLVERLHLRYPSTIELASKRGIGGVGQGAYGAFRAAIKNPGVFSSISVTDGPLDFDGADGLHGLISLFDDALLEQQTYYAMDPELDSLDNPLPFEFRRDFDSSQSMPISQMMIGGAFAFSPNDTAIDYTRRIDTVRDGTGRVIATTLRVEDVVQHQLIDTTLPGGGDSTTFIGGIVKGDSQTRNIDMDFHLPFDANGVVYTPIWDRWMANNLEDLHVAAGGTPLDGVSMWFATNRDAKWGYYDMTQSWISYLRTQPSYSVEEYEYASYNSNPVTSDEYLFDILREMLIFHSNNFGE